MRKKVIISLVSAIVLISALQISNIEAKTITNDESHTKGKYGPFPCGIFKAILDWANRLNQRDSFFFLTLALMMINAYLGVVTIIVGDNLGVNVFEDCQLCASS